MICKGRFQLLIRIDNNKGENRRSPSQFYEELEALFPRVSLPGLFNLNGWEARRGYRALLDRLGHALVRGGLRDRLLWLVGHADSTGSEGYNLRLTRQRAASVREYLMTRWGVARERLMVEGRGEAQPLASNETP